jgi:hypothetical protein
VCPARLLRARGDCSQCAGTQGRRPVTVWRASENGPPHKRPGRVALRDVLPGPSGVTAAVVAAVRRPHPTPHRRTIVPQFSAAAGVAFVVKRAARDGAVIMRG